MKSLVTVYLLVTLLDQSLVINCDGDHHHDHGDARNSFGLLGGNNNNNGGSSSGGVSSGYGVPSGGGVSSGYGAPSSGYGAPSSSYGGGGGGGGYDGGAPVYVYQQGGNDNNGGGGGGLLGGAGGLLAALLPIGGLALLGGLGILAFGSLFPTTTITGRKKRSVNFGNTTTAAQEQQIMLLQNYMNSLELPEMNLHKDMVAKYLECGSGQSYDAPSLHGCLQKLSCILYDDSIGISENEREIANIVIESIMGNEFISKDLKKSIHVAGKKGARSPGSCDLYKCHHHLLPQQF